MCESTDEASVLPPPAANQQVEVGGREDGGGWAEASGGGLPRLEVTTTLFYDHGTGRLGYRRRPILERRRGSRRATVLSLATVAACLWLSLEGSQDLQCSWRVPAGGRTLETVCDVVVLGDAHPPRHYYHHHHRRPPPLTLPPSCQCVSVRGPGRRQAGSDAQGPDIQPSQVLASGCLSQVRRRSEQGGAGGVQTEVGEGAGGDEEGREGGSASCALHCIMTTYLTGLSAEVLSARWGSVRRVT
ncbi:hypothetical protein Pcinc_036934 [Petrolisthes cinctipes]|uniref:Uncharacterized protein n=1 Tax=Petrolisthes cinctipes TaxID=88211 RepID=A0AAE1BV31_PETCI|nr:hypothetical protein Pcinc_036934 [Petrolisthes cinctipes]